MRNLVFASLILCVGCHPVAVNYCHDGVRDGTESDVDCGGASCARCPDGLGCRAPSDCVNGSCVNGVCAAASTCADFVRDGDETDIDCGGSVCAPCGDGRVCAQAADCASGMCSTTLHCQEGAFTVPHDVYAVAGGAGLFIAPGQMAGYGITAAIGGNSFCLVWTGDGSVTNQYHEFFGSVYTSGVITQVIPGCPNAPSVAAPDYVSGAYSVSGGDRVDFDAANVASLQGFNVIVGNASTGTGEPVFFDLFIDGVHNNQAIIFADATQNAQATFPQDVPFGLITQ